MYYIYKIINLINNKLYIGKTSRSLEVRFKEHINEANNLRQNSHSKIHHAMNKYGINNFKIELIEELEEDDKLLNKRERYWINFYDAQNKGYNLASGGEGKSLTDKQIASIRQKWEEGKNCIEIAEELYIPHSTVYHRVCNYEDYIKEENIKRSKKNQFKPITVYDITGNKIKDYDSMAEAGRDLQIAVSAISNALKLHYSIKGYRFSFKGENLIINTNKKIVEQYTLDKQYITSYLGAREAARQLNIGYTGIIKTCNGQQKTAGGYFWKYAE